jgi:hypothetical protein
MVRAAWRCGGMAAAGLAAWLCLAGARAGEVPPDNGVRGEFQGRQGLGCVFPAGVDPRTIPHVPGQPCLHIGPISVGQTRVAIEQLLGPPAKTLTPQAGVEARAYGLPAATKANSAPYFLVSYRGDRAFAVQLTGPPTSLPFRFTTLALGDPEAALLARLGTPLSRKPVPDIPDAVLWAYGGANVSIELKAGVIYSMRVAYAPPFDGSP